ncbi:glutamate transport system substrate-binding protein [Friedmanniella luteola]|uniref:Glutamate transport system substrate-binding protein n=1 Tax=Friedmanniella luteola TaxID=546871 RepID=A0A1H1YNN2_9ACTN|nr:glutamate ABC transporter substrate-binding protein [Friedmanniella luteola]SDT23024.1 glutamate transport system substrate-binding protein [Friedmanniella luteola]
MHANVHRTVVTAAVAGLTVTLLAACSSGGGPAAEPSLVPGASSGGTLKIGISFDEPGLGLKSGDGYAGFDVDTATYVAKALGVPAGGITWVEAQPADREKLLADGSVDLVFATYSITEERRQQVDFAGPYFVAHQDLLVRRNDEDITGPDTLNGRSLCSVTGTTSAQLVKERYRGKISLQELPRYSDCVTKLADGEVDAVTTDDLILAGYAAQKQYKGVLRLVGRGFSDELYGVGVKKGSPDMVTKVNAALKQYIADGSWERSLKKEVGPSGYAIPNPPSPGV